MTTLRVEHPVRDFELWLTAFDNFSDIRARSGVRGYTIRRPADDPQYLMLDLEFDSRTQATAFADFLYQRVWSSGITSPAISGSPRTRILDVVRESELTS